jgi:hypothetical protein
VCRLPMGLLYLLRWRQWVASVRQRSGVTRSSIHMPHMRPRKGKRHVGCGDRQGK